MCLLGQRVGQGIWREEFPTVDTILEMYKQSEPTVQKVLALFSANPMSKEQSESLKYLQKFVRGRNKEQLRQLLRFLTGSDMLCVQKIEISFVVRYGVGRVPTAHVDLCLSFHQHMSTTRTLGMNGKASCRPKKIWT